LGPYGVVGAWRRCRWILTDPATWRDLVWLLLAPVSLALGLLPAGLIVQGVEGIVAAPVLIPLVPDYEVGIGWAFAGPAWLMAPLAVVQGALLLPAGLAVAPMVLRVRARFLALLLAPTTAAALSSRVRELTRTRADAMDSQAAELRRIERDLHDGAQARMVALGMSLGMAEDLVLRDPETARQLLTEARQASDTALAELRDLVRGIHPPVLAERGLDGAVRALALDLPLPVDVGIDLPGRASAPIETAAYFAVAEALANAVKHSGAGRVRVRLAGTDGALLITVTDDGHGGADPHRGTGLRGIERRLAAHDGRLVVASPPGGPTVLTMEVPCEWSSRRTSPSSGTG
ncbi:MAG: histidine kinase, partial [Actinocatenispora sp.]